MDGTNPTNMMPGGAPAPNADPNNQVNNSMMPEAAGSAGQAQGNIDPNMMAGNNMGGMNVNNMNQNDLMAAMLMQQQLQQQQQQQQQMALQMMAQGINPMQMGMMGGMGGGDSSGNAGGIDNSQDLMLMQLLMTNPMAANLMAQGINPLILLAQGGGMGGMMGQNQLGAASGMMGNSATAPAGLSGQVNTPTIPQPAVAPKQIIESVVPAAAKGKRGRKNKVKGKPKRPLSAYNFFFREERERILDSIKEEEATKEEEKKEDEAKGDDKKEETKEVKKEQDVKEEEEKKADDDSDKKVESPKKEDETKESDDKDYDKVGSDGKKIPHGKIGFENLAKLIGKRWQELDAKGMERYKKLADEDMARYKREMEVFLTKEAQEGAQHTVDGAIAMAYGGAKRSGGKGTEKGKKKKVKTEVKEEVVFA